MSLEIGSPLARAHEVAVATTSSHTARARSAGTLAPAAARARPSTADLARAGEVAAQRAHDSVVQSVGAGQSVRPVSCAHSPGLARPAKGQVNEPWCPEDVT